MQRNKVHYSYPHSNNKSKVDWYFYEEGYVKKENSGKDNKIGLFDYLVRVNNSPKRKRSVVRRTLWPKSELRQFQNRLRFVPYQGTSKNDPFEEFPHDVGQGNCPVGVAGVNWAFALV
jgi:ribosomal protein S8